MPLDNTGAPAPRSPWALRLERLKLIRRKASAEQCEEKRYGKARLRTAEQLLSAIIGDADFLAEAESPDLWSGKSIFLLVSLHPQDFNRLCDYGAELEDLEDTCDAEPSHGADALELDNCDNEYSFDGRGMCPAGMQECEQTGYGFGAQDRA